MSLFKIKNNKVIVPDNRVTLDAKHNSTVKQFNNDKKNLGKFKKELKLLHKELSSIKSIPLKKMNLEEIENKFILENKINDLSNKIKDINSNKNEYNYYLKTSDVLYNYYNKNSSNSNKNDTNNTNKYSNKVTDSKNTILDFFDKFNDNNKSNEEIDTSDKFNKANLLEEYLKKTESNNYKVKSKEILNYDYCKECNVEKYLYQSEGKMICPKCGAIDYVVIDSNKPSYKDPPPEVSYFAYKRINHFNEWLAQFQAKESTEIPQEVFDKILIEIKKERIDNMANLTNLKIREFLKKLKLNKYYEHVPHIINRLNGLPPPVMSNEVEEKLRIMFKEIQAPFIEVCPKERKNFLSYSYVLHKFVELLELDQYKSCFPLLKSREKLHQQDIIWKNICKKLNWHYIKSI
tara:strand:- start:520 stop:1734 length:1215 start_codon:yes stop_codon:yes gene_type:complete